MQQLRGHAQIDGRSCDVGVAQVGGEEWQQALHVLPFAVPGSQPMDGERMSQVVQARLTAGSNRTLQQGNRLNISGRVTSKR